jgi:Protein of unknown function with HXXEE motif
MNKQIKIVFLLLVLTQALHSVEEWVGKLWEVLPPAQFISGLISKNLQTGFIIFNVGLFVFGVFCWRLLVVKNYSTTPVFIFFWIIIEIINGVGHPAWTLLTNSYEPGLYTAPLLLVLSVYLCFLILRFRKKSLKLT